MHAHGQFHILKADLSHHQSVIRILSQSIIEQASEAFDENSLEINSNVIIPNITLQYKPATPVTNKYIHMLMIWLEVTKTQI